MDIFKKSPEDRKTGRPEDRKTERPEDKNFKLIETLSDLRTFRLSD